MWGRHLYWGSPAFWPESDELPAIANNIFCGQMSPHLSSSEFRQSSTWTNLLVRQGDYFWKDLQGKKYPLFLDSHSPVHFAFKFSAIRGSYYTLPSTRDGWKAWSAAWLVAPKIEIVSLHWKNREQDRRSKGGKKQSQIKLKDNLKVKSCQKTRNYNFKVG